MLPQETTDPEYPTSKGSRLDKTNLIDEWLKNKQVHSLYCNIKCSGSLVDEERCVTFLFFPQRMHNMCGTNPNWMQWMWIRLTT